MDADGIFSFFFLLKIPQVLIRIAKHINALKICSYTCLILELQYFNYFLKREGRILFSGNQMWLKVSGTSLN